MKIDRWIVGLICLLLVIMYFVDTDSDEMYTEYMLGNCEMRIEYWKEVTVCR